MLSAGTGSRGKQGGWGQRALCMLRSAHVTNLCSAVPVGVTHIAIMVLLMRHVDCKEGPAMSTWCIDAESVLLLRC
jgi:hypothetical protein